MPDYKVWKTLEPSPAPGVQCYHCSKSDTSYPWYLQEFAGKHVYLRMYELRAGKYPCVYHLLARWDLETGKYTPESLETAWDLVTGERTVPANYKCPVKAVAVHTYYHHKRLYFSRNKRTLKKFVKAFK